MRLLLRDMGYEKITVHGFRSSFKTWAIERTEHPDWLTELCLGHEVGSKARRVYIRGDALDKHPYRDGSMGHVVCPLDGSPMLVNCSWAAQRKRCVNRSHQ